MLLCRFIDCRFNIIRQNNTVFPTQYGRDMFITNQHIMQSSNLTDNLIIHRNNARLKRTAELKIRFPVLKKQHICRVTPYVNNKNTERMDYQAALWHYGSIRLREYHDTVNQHCIRLVLICKLNHSTFKITGKLIFQYTIMFGRKPNC